MKKILLALSLVPYISLAQTDQSFGNYHKPVVCAPIEAILKGIADPQVAEQPIWIGKDESEKSEYVLFVHPKTKAFTLVQIGQKVGCVLGMGYSSYLLEGEKH